MFKKLKLGSFKAVLFTFGFLESYSTNEMFYIYFFGGIALIIYLIEKKIKEIMGE